MADQLDVQLIVRAIAEGFDKLNKDIAGTGKAGQEGEKGLDKFGISLNKVGVIAGGAAVAGITALGAGLYSSIQAAAEAQQVQAQLEAVIRSTGGAAGLTAEEINEMAGSLAQVTTFGDDAIVKAQSLLLTFTNIGEEVFPRATETMLDMATALGTDASGGAIQLGKALNDPIQGITALTRVGVSFTEQQKEQIRTMVEAGDVMGAQTIILDELAKEFGGSARAAAETFSGRMAQLRDRVGEAQETIGGAFLPALTELAEDALPALEQSVEELGPVIETIAEENLPEMVAQLSALIRKVPDVVSGLDDIYQIGKNIEKLTLPYWIERAAGEWEEFAIQADYASGATSRAQVVTGVYNQKLIYNTATVEGHTRAIVAEGNAYDYLIPKVEEVTESTEALTGAYDFMIQESIRNENRMESYAEELVDVRLAEEEAGAAAYEAAIKRKEANEAAVLAAEALAEAERELAAQTGSYFDMSINATGATATLEERMYQAALAAGADAGSLALLTGALDLSSDAAIEAAVQYAATQIEIDRLGQLYADGKIKIDEYITGVQNFVAGLQGAETAAGPTASAIDTGPTRAIRELGNEADITAGKISNIPKDITITTTYQSVGEPPPGLGGGAVGGANAGGGATGGGGAGFASGTDFIVPPGYPNDSYGPLWVQSGEHVKVTPAGQSGGGGGVTIMPGAIQINGSNMSPSGIVDELMKRITQETRWQRQAGGAYVGT